MITYKINFDTDDFYNWWDIYYCENKVAVYKKLQELIGLDFMKYKKYDEEEWTFISRMMNEKEKTILINLIYKNKLPLNIDCKELFSFDIKILVDVIYILK